jgi:ADP-ribosylglycohydrolase
MDPRRIALLAVASKWDDDRSQVLAVLESIATEAIPDLKDEAASIVEQLKKKLEADKTR